MATSAASAAGHQTREKSEHKPKQRRQCCDCQAGGDEQGNAPDEATGCQRPQLGAENTACHGAHHRDGKKHEDGKVRPLKTVLHATDSRHGRGQGLTRDERHQLIHRRVESTGEVPLLETRGDGLVNDALGCQVGNGALQRFGDFNADPPVVFGHYQQESVADLLAANLPAVGDPVAVTGDVLGLRRWHQQQHHLCAPALLKGGEFGLQLLHLLRVQRTGGVHDMGNQRRHGQLRLRL